MPVAEIKTTSGGTVDFEIINSMLNGTYLSLHIDQSSNVRSGEDEASILLTVNECKEIISILNRYIYTIEGKDFVLTKDSVINLISHPDLQDVLKKLEEMGDIIINTKI